MRLMRKLIIAVIALVIALPVGYKLTKTIVRAYQEADAQAIKDRGQAAELELTNNLWVNTDKPIRLEDLRGQVVVLEFWRIDCPECFHSLDYLREIPDHYAGRDVKLISIHFPETYREHDLNAVMHFIDHENITYPVGIDHDRKLWNDYQITAAPTFVIIDKQGRIRYRHIGEGRFQQLDQVIEQLLAEA
jgi:peroxiredoxin